VENFNCNTDTETWKTSTVIPIQKIKNTKKLEEIRPINTLAKYEQIIERVIKTQLYDFLESNYILCEQQSEFSNNNSCETALNLVLEEWIKINMLLQYF
jgi:hypothetical protein